MKSFCQTKRKDNILLPLLLFIVLLCSCAGVKERETSPLEKYRSSSANLKVAVLPFENDTSYPEAGRMLRETFYGVLSTEPFVDIELSKLDDILDENGIFTPEDIKRAGYKKIRDLTGADLLFFGRVIKHNALYLVLYSFITVELEIHIVDAKKGQEIYKTKRKLRNIGGTFPTPPFEIFSIIPSPLASLINLSTRSFQLADWELCKMIVDDLSLKIK
ncbi:MAG: hypothetical protein D6734_05305 [Candidatus Schekmanbacteria bacterium]|nr:MAG: hypothetical protein D6734_05305 [Candidatus Schekmanbacteria bacterium]